MERPEVCRHQTPLFPAARIRDDRLGVKACHGINEDLQQIDLLREVLPITSAMSSGFSQFILRKPLILGILTPAGRGPENPKIPCGFPNPLELAIR
jgi:hypothetical protein